MNVAMKPELTREPTRVARPTSTFYLWGRRLPTVFRGWAVVGLLLMGLLAAGCSAAGPKGEAGEDESSPWGAGAAAERAGESLEVTASVRRLRQEAARSFAAMEWAVLRIEGGEVGADAADLLDGSSEGQGPALRAWALLADGRTAAVVGRLGQRVAGEDAIGGNNYRISVYCRVGRFGDAALERSFLDELAKKLRGKPQRQRIFFVLPSP